MRHKKTSPPPSFFYCFCYALLIWCWCIGTIIPTTTTTTTTTTSAIVLLVSAQNNDRISSHHEHQQHQHHQQKHQHLRTTTNSKNNEEQQQQQQQQQQQHGQEQQEKHHRRFLGSIPNGPFPPGWPYKANCLNPTIPGGFLNTTLPSCSSIILEDNDNTGGGGAEATTTTTTRKKSSKKKESSSSSRPAKRQKSEINKDDRIAIVGAGPAGISMAYLLKKRGFEQITIFEKENRVGGKSKTVKINGDRFDAGTIFSTNKYECVELLFDEFNMTEVSIEATTKPRIVFDPDILSNSGNNFGTLYQWEMEYSSATYGVTYNNNIFEYFGALQADVPKYFSLWTQTMGSFEYYFPDEDTVNFDLLNMSYLEWLEQAELYALISRLHLIVSSQGYGSMSQIPAYYGLSWIHPNFLVAGGSGSVLQEDWQLLWERIVTDLNLNVVLEASIKKIKRKSNKVNILYTTPDSPKTQSEKFDKLIMAVPMPDGLSLLDDATDEELELFSSYNYKSVKLDIGRITDAGLLDAGAGLVTTYDIELFSFMGRADLQTDYHVKFFNEEDKTLSREQWLTDGIDGIITLGRLPLIKQRDKNTDICQIFSILPLSDLLDDDKADNVTTTMNEDATAADLALLGVEFDNIVTSKFPDYFPWKNNTDIINGRVPWRIWDIQGNLNTWFIGSYASFESVADVVDYNLKLINERLCI